MNYLFATAAAMASIVSIFAASFIGTSQQTSIAAEMAPVTIKHAPPLPVLSDTEKEALFEIAKSTPGLKEWAADGWQLLAIDFTGTEEPAKWTHATVHMQLPANVKAVKDCAEGWEAMVEIDLETKQLGVSDVPSATNDMCGGVTFGGPIDISAVTSTADSNSLIPQAFALTSSNGYAVARQYDVLGSIDHYYGNLAYLKTPTISSTIYPNMNHFVGMLLNAYFGPGKYEQMGWTATSENFCTGCGVSANSKAIIIVDQSVYGNLYGHNTNLPWINGATLLVEHICQSNGKYGQEFLYNGVAWGHFTNVPCTTSQVSGDTFNNAVYFENVNTSNYPPSGWAPKITTAVTAQNAYEAKNSSNNWVLWSSSVNSDKNCLGAYASTVITGNLQNAGIATWSSLTNIPSWSTC